MDLYERVLIVARPYLGAMTESFIERQCKRHLGIRLEALTSQHLDELAHWCYSTGRLVIDEAEAKELGEQIKVLEAA